VTDRAEFLARLRGQLDSTQERDALVPMDWAVEIDDPVQRMEVELKAVGGTLHRCTPDRRADVLAAILKGRDAPAVLVTRDENVPSGVESVVASAGAELRWWPDVGRDGAATAEVGVTGALWAVAETGTVVLGSAPPGGRAPSLLPSAHVAFVAESRLLPTVRELFVRIAEMESYPSNLVLITGPSKSADIGNELALGVHGPGELHVVLVEDA
jgi:L-lactate dehydrogenase complex protein LldG